MRKRLLTLCLLTVGGLFFMEPLSAQDGQGSEGSLLPEIDPQDIEIRSQYRARFPGLRRQPILGFTPGSRVFQVDPDRLPFLEDHEEIAAQLPVGELTRPQAPSYETYPYAKRSNGYGRFGIGNYLSPDLEFHLNQELSETQWFTGAFDYLSGDGHLDQKSSFRQADFRAGYIGSIGEKMLLETYLGGLSDFNYLILPGVVAASENPGRKTYNSFNGGGSFTRYRSRVDYFEGGIEGEVNTIVLDDERFQLSDELSDWRVGGDAALHWAGNKTDERFSVRADLEAGGYDNEAGMNDFWHIAQVNAAYNRLFNHQTRLHVSLGAAHSGDAVEQSAIYFTPDLGIEHTFTDYVGLSASLSGTLDQQGQMKHHQANRFLLPGNLLRNKYDLTASVELMIEPLAANQIRIGTAYRSIKNFAWYQRVPINTGNAIVPGQYSIEYDDVTIPEVFAGIGVDLVRERVWFDVEGYLQSPRISDTEKVPFEEEFGLTGALTIRPVDILHFEFWGAFIGPRSTPEQNELPAYLDLGTKLELRITDRVGVYGQINNLLNQEYEIWEGYTERPFQMFGGITLHL